MTPPDFTFQIGKGTQESLSQQRGRNIVLLVFYSHAYSVARLRALADSRLRLDRLGVRVVAVPLKEADALPPKMPGVDATMLAGPDAPLAAAYAMFLRTLAGPPQTPPLHAELLIDRQGYLRARWIPGKEPRGESIWTLPELQRQAALLNKEKRRPPAPERHAH